MVMTRRRSRQLSDVTGLSEEELLALDEGEIPALALKKKQQERYESQAAEVRAQDAQSAGGDWHNHLHGDVYAPLVLVFWPLLPVLTMSVHLIINKFNCSMTDFFSQIMSGELSFSKYLELVPRPNWTAACIYFGWILLQLVLFYVTPGRYYRGQPTPAGHRLEYKIVAFRNLIITMVIGVLVCGPLDLLSPATIYDNFGPMLSIALIFMTVLTFVMFIKAKVHPTYDAKSTGNVVLDLFGGIELNPRIGGFDIKLFSIGHVGMNSIVMVNMLMAWKQYDTIGYVTNSMVLVNLFLFLYTADWAWSENWYLATLDIMAEHFGYFLCYGGYAGITWLYTVQAQYLAVNPVDLPLWGVVGLLSLNTFCLYMFREINGQRQLFRAKDGDCLIWGKPPKFITATCTTSNGVTVERKLLTSGYWGLARHLNYLPDLTMAFTWCMCTGFHHAVPFFYTIHMGYILGHRMFQDDKRCSLKYKLYWEEYKRQVPYHLIPYVF